MNLCNPYSGYVSTIAFTWAVVHLPPDIIVRTDEWDIEISGAVLSQYCDESLSACLSQCHCLGTSPGNSRLLRTLRISLAQKKRSIVLITLEPFQVMSLDLRRQA